jgi:hypothetical protein
MFEGILVVGCSLKVEIYTVPAYVPLLTCDKFAGTHQLFIGMSTGAYQLEKHRLHWATKMNLFLVTWLDLIGYLAQSLEMVSKFLHWPPILNKSNMKFRLI